MTYAVRVMVINEDSEIEPPLFDRVLDNHESLDDAIEHASGICTEEYLRTGIEPMPIDHDRIHEVYGTPEHEALLIAEERGGW